MRWWRPLASVGGAVLAAAVLLTIFGGLEEAAVALGAGRDALNDEAHPLGMLSGNLFLALGIPLALLATWAGYGRRPGRVSSVAGRVRWGWLGWCLAASGAAGALGVAGLAGLAGLAGVVGVARPPAQWSVMLAVILLTTPLQSAGEEYVFRGWMSQLLGSVVPVRVASAVLAGAVSAILFALGHDGAGVWGFADKLVFGVVAWWVVDRTGGLEAAIAVHTGFNVMMGVFALVGPHDAPGDVGSMDWSGFVLLQVLLLFLVGAVMLLVRWRRPARVQALPAVAS
jgi:membrane protease YdiL (CAAX protease family)